MSYVITPSIGINLAQLGNGDGTTAGALIPAYALGTRVVANDGVYQYVKSTAAITLYDFVKITNTFGATSATTTLLPSTEPAKCGVANQVAATAASQYLWVFVGPGLVTVNCLASCVQDVRLYTTATGGSIDDTATTLINGLKLIATITGAAASPCVATAELSTVVATND